MHVGAYFKQTNKQTNKQKKQTFYLTLQHTVAENRCICVPGKGLRASMWTTQAVEGTTFVDI